MWKTYGNLFDVLFPPACLFCKKKIGRLFCEDCLNTVQFSETLKGFIETLEVTAPLEYEGVVRECIKASKYGSKQFAALAILSNAAVSYVRLSNVIYENYIVAPVPLNPRKYRTRGFNQAEIIARAIAQEYKLPLALNLLKRTKQTEGQYKLSKDQRRENVAGAFTCAPSLVKGKNILVVDDICTTGTTLLEIFKVLKTAGVGQVKAFCLSKVS